jgi:hypothetical protein
VLQESRGPPVLGAVSAVLEGNADLDGFFIMLMLVMCAISEDDALALGGRSFPKDHTMIVICPTKALQQDMARVSSILYLLVTLLCFTSEVISAGW